MPYNNFTVFKFWVFSAYICLILNTNTRRYANYITFIIEFRLKTIIKIKFSSGNDRVWQPWAGKVSTARRKQLTADVEIAEVKKGDKRSLFRFAVSK